MQRAGLSATIAALIPVLFSVPALAAPDYDGDGFTDNDCRPLDPAAHPGATDEPDLALEDLDCDGVDGAASDAFFVAKSGDDAGTGSKDIPFKTIQFAIDRAAAASPTRDVYVAGGVYTERVVLASGVSVYGGYKPGGARAADETTTIQAPAGVSEAVFADGAVGVELQLLTVLGADLTDGASSYAIRAIGGSSLALTGVTATGGDAGAGASGSQGAIGASGADGKCGGSATGQGCNVDLGGGAGGAGQPHSGGTGAESECPTSGCNGLTGSLGAGPSGGAGGGGGAPIIAACGLRRISTCHGGFGQGGGDGAPGTPGVGAEFDSASAGATWQNAAAATAGQGDGTPGSGGGGGGSGKWVVDSDCEFTDVPGGSGGGGGGGGGPGGGGGGAGNGGGSFGVYLFASAVVVDGGLVSGGAGGAGGTGGAGGIGPGGLGGPGQPGFTASGGPGCNLQAFDGGIGGPGGDGGQGGGGGGGAGGPSVGVFAASTSKFVVSPSGAAAGGVAGAGGAQGAGGTSPDAAGTTGVSAATLAQPGANASGNDFDGDGKLDADDACPAVAGDGADGCRTRTPVLADLDGDGVPDSADGCPAAATGGQPCDDGNVCTASDTCAADAATCMPGAPLALGAAGTAVGAEGTAGTSVCAGDRGKKKAVLRALSQVSKALGKAGDATTERKRAKQLKQAKRFVGKAEKSLPKAQAKASAACGSVLAGAVSAAKALLACF
jgi:hypothetical protein